MVQVDTTVVSIVAFYFLKKAAIIIATQVKKHYNDRLLSGMYNCNFEAIN